MKIICIIPAKEKSRRLKDKNILKIKNKLLIQITLNKSLKIKEFDRIIVSSDSEKILNLSKKYKNILFFRRPKKYSTSKSDMGSVITHITKVLYKTEKLVPSIIVLLQPTSPLRKISTIKKTIKIFKRHLNYDYLATIKKVNHKEYPNMQINFSNKNFNKRKNFKINNTHSKKVNYALDGGVIFMFRNNKKNKVNNYKLSGYGKFVETKFPENIDIDTKEDFDIAKKFI
ncbi:MAG: hypothetical protein CBC82_07415 [Cellvibrionales bacterium TMED122]|nr:MAG: hypothetical protein CBC82_07415 [Cellvibrionales bacterium TMED122]|tara:strand:+ start:3561 stop:4247 length:687 start_codon:yes stop_codon:yes gene_type:complete